MAAIEEREDKPRVVPLAPNHMKEIYRKTHGRNPDDAVESGRPDHVKSRPYKPRDDKYQSK